MPNSTPCEKALEVTPIVEMPLFLDENVAFPKPIVIQNHHIMMNPGIYIDEIRKYVMLGATMLEIGKDLKILHDVWVKLCSEVKSLKS